MWGFMKVVDIYVLDFSEFSQGPKFIYIEDI